MLREYVDLSDDHPCGLVWIKKPANNVQVGDPAFATLSGSGYYHGEFRGCNYLAHRVRFYLMHNYWPVVVDHVLGGNDNRTPLRAASVGMNNHNQKARGCSLCKITGKWRADICVEGTRINLGRYATAEEAHARYLRAKRELHPTAPERCYDTEGGLATPRKAVSDRSEAQS